MSTTSASEKKTGRTGVIFVLLLLAGAVFLLWWEVHQIQTQLQRGQMVIASEQRVISTLQGDVQHLAAQNAQPMNIWAMARIDHLLQMTDYALRFSDDVAAAKALLTLIKQQAQSLDASLALALGQRIDAHIQVLNALPHTDVGELLARVEGLRQQLPALPVMPLMHTTTMVKTPLETPKKQAQTPVPLHPMLIKLQRWAGHLWEMTQDGVKRAVIVRYHAAPITPLLPPGEQVQLVHNIDLKLSQIGWAALHHHHDLYQANITQIITWINQHYPVDQPPVYQFLKGLQVLQSYHLKPNLPDMSATLGWFRQQAAHAGGSASGQWIKKTPEQKTVPSSPASPVETPTAVNDQPAAPRTDEL
jgi:uroporphyrin-3 C-methyltransferase